MIYHFDLHISRCHMGTWPACSLTTPSALSMKCRCLCSSRRSYGLSMSDYSYPMHGLWEYVTLVDGGVPSHKSLCTSWYLNFVLTLTCKVLLSQVPISNGLLVARYYVLSSRFILDVVAVVPFIYLVGPGAQLTPFLTRMHAWVHACTRSTTSTFRHAVRSHASSKELKAFGF